MEMKSPEDRIRYLSEVLGVIGLPGHLLAGCADALSRDLQRCNDLAELIRPLANELILIAQGQLEGWEMTRESMREGADFIPKTPAGATLVADENNEATTRITELNAFIAWLSTP